MLPLDRFCRYIAENKLFTPDQKVLVAVSGGRDSVLLAHLFNAAGFKFGIAHCNFMLRDEESMADELFTKSLAGHFSVPFYSTRFRTQDYADSHAISIQMAARDMRYDWLENIRKEAGYDYIAVAHHQNDTVETILLNLVRGTGVAGLHGISAKRGKIVRPMLFLTREEVDELIRREKISFREDSSNLSSKYARNKVRMEVIPKLKELNPKLEETFNANARRFSDLELILNQRVSEVRGMVCSFQPDESVIIDIPELRKITPLHTLLFEILKPYHFKQPVVDDLVKSLDSQPGKIFESPSHIILIDRKRLLLQPRRKEELQTVEILEGFKEGSWDEMVFAVKTVSADLFRVTKSAGLSQLDAALLVYPLKLRAWKKGDRFKPFGLHGEKKLSDFFIGLKVPVTQKANIPVLENGNGDIVCIPGVRIDDRYKITANTKKVFIFELIKPDGK